MTQYKKVQIKEGTAYVQSQFVDVVNENINSYKPLQVSDFVIAPDNSITKSRYLSEDLIETYLIVNSNPLLRKLINLYNQVNKIITKA